MDREAFAQEMGRFVRRAPGGYLAFYPPPLPPELVFDSSAVRLIADAERKLGFLAGAGGWLPNPHLLIRPFMRREAVLSSKIEGTQATVGDLVLFEIESPAAEDRAPDVREVANYVRALELAVDPDRSLPVSLRLLRDLHRRLMTGVRGEHMTPGEFRRSQNWIGPPGCLLDDAMFVPPPIDEMHECLTAFERFMHEPSELPALVRIGLLHAQFEMIHPFLDGNGRVGRLLISLLLHEWNLLPQPLLYLSAYFEEHQAEYYERLLGVSTSGAWGGWLSFFLTGVAEQADDVIARIARLTSLREGYRERLQSGRGSALLLRLVDHLFGYPAVRISTVQQVLGITYRSAALDVSKLEAAQILREVTGRSRNRLYMAEEILRVVQ